MVIVFTNMKWACTTVSNSYTSYWRRIGSFEKAHTQTHKHRDTYTHRIQTHSNTHADTHTDTHKQWDTHIQTHIQKNTTNSHTWKHRQTNRQTDRQTDRHTHTHTHTQLSIVLITFNKTPTNPRKSDSSSASFESNFVLQWTYPCLSIFSRGIQWAVLETAVSCTFTQRNNEKGPIKKKPCSCKWFQSTSKQTT